MPAAVDFEKEFQDVLDAFFHSADPDRTALQGLTLAFKELSDFAGKTVDALDPQDRETELPALKRSLVSVALRNLDRFKLGLFMRGSIAAAIPTIIPSVVDAAADKTTVVAVYRDKYVVPGLDYVIKGAWTTRKLLAPDAPALVLE